MNTRFFLFVVSFFVLLGSFSARADLDIKVVQKSQRWFNLRPQYQNFNSEGIVDLEIDILPGSSYRQAFINIKTPDFIFQINGENAGKAGYTLAELQKLVVDCLQDQSILCTINGSNFSSNLEIEDGQGQMRTILNFTPRINIQFKGN